MASLELHRVRGNVAPERKGQPFGHILLAGAAIALAVHFFGGASAASAATDPLFQQPYVDTEEWREQPVRHRYVHGGFKGTEARFSIYFPPKEQYQGRFFQHITPTPSSENLAQRSSGEDNKIGFSIASGAYLLETNEGGMAAMSTDPSLAAYRVNAAAAQYSRVLAAQMYGSHRPYGYAYGGSGGGFRTIGGIENTTGVWDGVVPYVIGSPMAIPAVYTSRLLAMRVLKDKFPAIVDAVEPGGSGDMYSGLNKEEREALAEVTGMGFPPRAWFSHKTLGMGAFVILFDMVIAKDPKYFEDFWKLPGYLGAEPPESLRHARIQHRTTVRKVITKDEASKTPGAARGGVDTAWQQLQGAPVELQLDSVPSGNLEGASLLVMSGAAASASRPVAKVTGDTITAGISMAAAMGMKTGGSQNLTGLKPGDEVMIDNSNFLAVQYHHRYQVPTPDFYVWNQFRGTDGKPLYPQRARLQGPEFAATAAGTVQSGRFLGKMIVVESLWDQDAFPWQADWYATKVKAALGPRFNDNFRLWFTDHALHGDAESQADPTHTVSYLGVLHQALRDLSAWVEKGVAPPASTNYKVVAGQVQVPPTAAERRGIQPVVTVKANGGARAEVAAGQAVTFTAVIEAPPQTGRVIAVEWDFEGAGKFEESAQPGEPSAAGTRVTLKTMHTFATPGTYFPTLRAISQRDGDAKTPYARIQNLGRVRVVVK